MAILENSRHEHFAQAVAKGVSASQAYVSAGYREQGAQQSSRRLLLNALVFSRVSEIQETDTSELWSTLGTRIAQLITERAADMADVPGGGTGLLARHYQGAQGMPVYKVDTGLVSLIGQLLAHDEKQAVEKLGLSAGNREISGAAAATIVNSNLRKGMMRVAEAKAAALARGEIWSD